MESDTLLCGAKRRRQYNDPGWPCTGKDLVKLMTGPEGVPVVVRADALPMLMAEPWADAYHPEPFIGPYPITGWDHYHAVITRPEVKVSER